MDWLIFMFVIGLYGVVVGTAHSVDKLAKSLEQENAKTQALLAEIEDGLGK